MSAAPTPRPALRKSADASLHPALAPRPGSVGETPAAGGSAQLHKERPASTSPAATADRGRQKGRPRRRGATSDVLRPTKKDPPVELTITVPKSVKRALKQAAKERGTSPDAYAAAVLASALQG